MAKSGSRDGNIGDWTIEAVLLEARVEGRGPAFECTGRCCRHGVYASLPERDRILENADRVQAIMDQTQTPDTSKWFEDEVLEDDDFTGGRCVGTAIYNDKCAFLNREGLCTLQIAEATLPADEHLKPYYCRIFPLCTTDGRIEFDDLLDGDQPCCTLRADGLTLPVEAYAYEFREILGEAGYGDLRARI